MNWRLEEAIDLAIVVVYLLSMVGVGLWLARRTAHTEAFMAADRRLPGWAVGLSIFGTFVSSISFLANPGHSYADNWNSFVFGLSLPLAAFIATQFFVPFYRRIGAVSAYSHLEERFGTWARLYAVFCYLLTQVARVGTILYLVSLVVAPLLPGVETWMLILAVGLLVTVYTLTGGIEAVIWTDVVQSVVLSAGMVICLVVLLANMPGGPAEVWEIANKHQKFDLGTFWFEGAAWPTFWVVLVYGLVINLQNFGIDQSYVQRYATAKSDAEAARSVWMGALLYLPTSAILFFIGTALFAYYTAHPEPLPMREGKVIADQVFPHFISTHLTVGVRGILIAAILAAAMSSVDSSLNSSATLVLCDVVRRFTRHADNERSAMAILYGATIFWGLTGTTAALAMIRIESALKNWWQLAGIFGGGMLGLFLLGRCVRRAGSVAAAIGVACGVLVVLWATLLHPENFFWKWLEHHYPDAARDGWLAAISNPLPPLLTIVLGTLTILLVGSLASIWFPRSRCSHRSGPSEAQGEQPDALESDRGGIGLDGGSSP